jgi:hypothetical protein
MDVTESNFEAAVIDRSHSLPVVVVETTRGGAQVAVEALDMTATPPGAPGNGALFGVAIPALF